MSKVSVIVPVYNVAEHLDRCLTSLIAQTLDDVEIIIVDDGSTDDSYSICKRYAMADRRIELLHKENGGLSSARNAGLAIVESECVVFVDADDYVAPQLLDVLYSKLVAESLDAVFCGYFKQNSDGRFVERKETDAFTCFCGRAAVNGFMMDMIGSEPEYRHTARHFMTVWRGMYSAKIIKENGLQFRDFISEDLVFNCDYLTKAKNVGLIPDCLYYYCWNGNSLSNTYNEARFKRDVEVYNELYLYLDGTEWEKYKSYLDKYLLLRARIDIAAISNTGFSLNAKKRLVEKIIDTGEFQTILGSYPYQRLHWPNRLLFLFMKRRMYGLLFLSMRVKTILKR